MASEPESLATTALSDEDVNKAGKFQHVARIATKCEHQLHPSAPSHLPYCPACVYSTAKSKLDTASDKLRHCGGLRRWGDEMGLEWKQAFLSYKVATKRWEEVRKRDQLRSEREQAWDKAHSSAHGSEIVPIKTGAPEDCSVCMSMMQHHSPSPEDVDFRPWWERGGAAASTNENGPQTPPQSHGRKRKRHGHIHQGSPTMRSTIRQHRAARTAERTEKEQVERRYKTETAVRRKHQLTDDAQFSSDFWDQPISNIITRQYHKSQKEIQRMSERRARGNTPRPRPPRSSLSFCESAANVTFDEDDVDAIRGAEEERERERMERRARKVGTEVGYLYFSGAIDGLQEWREDFLRSNHELVWRDPHQRHNEVDPSEAGTTENVEDETENVEDAMEIDE